MSEIFIWPLLASTTKPQNVCTSASATVVASILFSSTVSGHREMKSTQVMRDFDPSVARGVTRTHNVNFHSLEWVADQR